MIQYRFATAIVALCLAYFCELPDVRAVAAVPTNADMTRWVREALREDPRVDVSDIAVTVKKGVVTLGGSVDNLAEKKYSDAEATKIRGVLGVINEISITPGKHNDADIAGWVTRRIENSATISSKSIHVACQNGVVTLTGSVGSNAEQNEAGLLASEIRGVRQVDNRLTVDRETRRRDEDIGRDAQETLSRDVYLTGLPIKVSVKNHVITLSGSVATAYETARAENNVRWMSGVEDVENRLKVEPWENEGVGKQLIVPSDDTLKEAIVAELQQDGRLANLDFDVKAIRGHVTLTGSVNNPFQKRLAEQDARDVVGVGGVTNNLKPLVEGRTDEAIHTDIELDLGADATTENLDIQVRVQNGVTTLSGMAHSWFEKEHATDLASRNWGVKDVVNRIRVEHAATKQDAELLKTIKTRLGRNATTSSVESKITVNVSRGVVRLEGDVLTWAQRKEAARVALLTDGASAIDNRITVNGYDYSWDEWNYKPAAQPWLFDPFRTPYHLDDYFHRYR